MIQIVQHNEDVIKFILPYNSEDSFATHLLGSSADSRYIRNTTPILLMMDRLDKKELYANHRSKKTFSNTFAFKGSPCPGAYKRGNANLYWRIE